MTLTKGKQTPVEMLTEMVVHKQTIHMYGVTDIQLDQLMAGYTSLHLVFLGICIGACISVAIPYFCNAVPEAHKIYFFAALLVSAALTLWSGIGAFGHWNSAKSIKDKLYKEDLTT